MSLRSLFLAILLCSVNAFADDGADVDCSNAITTMEVDICASRELEIVETDLNKAYQSLMRGLTKPEPGEEENYALARKRLLEAQRAWVTFREADCQAQYALHASGTIRNAIYIGCMSERATQRIKELRNYAPY